MRNCNFLRGLFLKLFRSKHRLYNSIYGMFHFEAKEKVKERA